MTLAQRTTNGAQTHHPAPISTIAAEPAAKPHAAVQGWKGCDIATLCQSSDLGAIYNTWMLLATGNLPRLNEVMANEQFAMLGNTALLLKLPHYLLFVHHGAAMALMIGRQFTGVLHLEIKGVVAREIEPIYNSCIADIEPVYIRYISQHSQQHFCIEQIAVPLAGDEGRAPAFIFIRSAPMDDKVDILKAIFDRSPIGMIATTASYSSDGKPQDGRIPPLRC